MLKSLYVFGRYRGGILVLTDRPETQVPVPDEMTDMVRILWYDGVGPSTRFQIQEFIGACDTPALYIDADTIVTQEVDPILRKMSTTSGIYASSSLAFWPQFANVPAAAISATTDPKKVCGWFGIDLFLDDAELRDRPLLFLNSGLFGYSERRIFERPARLVHDMYTSDRWSSIKFFGDQPFFNYALAKLERIDSWLLSGALALVATAEAAVQCGGRPFVLFPFAAGLTWLEKGQEKARQMSQYMNFLESSRGGHKKG